MGYTYSIHTTSWSKPMCTVSLWGMRKGASLLSTTTSYSPQGRWIRYLQQWTYWQVLAVCSTMHSHNASHGSVACSWADTLICQRNWRHPRQFEREELILHWRPHCRLSADWCSARKNMKVYFSSGSFSQIYFILVPILIHLKSKMLKTR